MAFPGSQYFYQNQHSRTANHRNGSPISNSRGLFQPNPDTPSPNRSPGTHSPAGNPYTTMYGNHGNHRQAHLLNGGAGHSFQTQLGLHKGFQSQSHGGQAHHLNNQAQEHALGGHGSAFANHQYSNSGSTLTSSTPHHAHLQNGSSPHTDPPNEHWAEQEAEYTRLKNAGDKPHYYARNSPHVSRFPGTSQSSITQRAEDEAGERRRAAETEDADEAGTWDALDLGGHGLRSMGASIFRHYPKLRKIYFLHNKLRWLPPDIGHMRALTVLDLSFNDLDSLPAEIGMLTHLKKLLLYGNNLRDLPFEIGSLFKLEVLGVVGNTMLRADYLDRIKEAGTKEFVRYLREQAPRKF